MKELQYSNAFHLELLKRLSLDQWAMVLVDLDSVHITHYSVRLLLVCVFYFLDELQNRRSVNKINVPGVVHTIKISKAPVRAIPV